MPDRPSRLWKDLPLDKRVAAAEAFWRDDQASGIEAQHLEAVVAIARRLNFRAKSVASLPVERRAKQLAQIGDVSDALATRALIAYHFAAQRPLMAAFLDALGLAHENGLITQEEVAPPDRDKLQAAFEAVRQAHPAEDVALYLRTLAALDGDTWVNLDALLAASH
jgi:Putative nucleotidyltransferase substrate binding domain